MPVCRNCCADKEQNAFGRRGSGYRNVCKVCRVGQQVAWAKANPDRVKAAYTRHRAKNPNYKPRTSRSPEEKAKIEREAKRDYYQRNRAARLAYAKERAALKRDEIRVYNALWRAQNADAKRANDAEWRRANPEKVNLYSKNRRARRLGAEPPWLTQEQKEAIAALYREAAARTAETGVQHDVDHIFPLQEVNFSGLHVPWNLRVVTSYVNKSKGNRPPAEYAHMVFAA